MSELREEATSFEIEVPHLGTFTVTNRADGLAGLMSANREPGWWVFNSCGLRLVRFPTKEAAVEAIVRVSPIAVEIARLRHVVWLGEQEADKLWCEGASYK